MSEADVAVEPDLDTPITLTLTPAALMDALFNSADSVHTGWDSCVEAGLVVADMTVVDDASGNHCRLVEQEYVEDESPDVTWHDWAVELKLGESFVTGHWRVQVAESPSEWDWCAAEAEDAFGRACVLVGKRVRRGLVVEEPVRAPRPSRTHH
jgi:hypothetical protein